jgi:hypothetical protein
MIPPGDFDLREQSSRRATYALAALFYMGAYGLSRYAYGPVIGFLVSSPVLGVYVSLLILHRGCGGLRWFKWLALRKVDGQFRAFQGNPISVRCSDGQCCVRASDLFRALGHVADDAALRRLALRFGDAQFFPDAAGAWWFGERAALEWLQARAARLDPVAIKCERWLRKEVFPPLRRRAERG